MIDVIKNTGGKDMLENTNFDYVTMVKSGSLYLIKGTKKMGYAFYYEVGGERMPRKVITGGSEKEIENKTLKFLTEQNEKYVHFKEMERIELEEKSKPVRKTFSEVGAEWYAEYGNRRFAKKKPISYSSYESRGYSLNKINKYIGSVYVSDITNEMAEKLIDRCSVKEDGTYYSKSAVDKLQQVFLLVMEYARKRGYCDGVIDKVELGEQLTVPEKDSRFIDVNELNKIFEVCQCNKRYYTFLKLLITTGLRQEEAFALHIDDFKVSENGVVEITINKTVVEEEGHQYNLVNRTKTKRSKRIVVIPMEVYEMVVEYYNDCISNESEMDKYLRSMYGTEGYIFVNKDMKHINKRTFERNLSDFLKRRGITEKTLHMFRHSYASLQAENITFEKVAMLLGDSPKTVYDMYYSMSQKSKESISDNVSTIYNQFEF